MLKVVAKVRRSIPMPEKMKPINLLPQKGEGFVNQFLSWALTIGRLLIILVETLALGTFLYRFSIDMKIIDLHDNIKTQSIIVRQFKDTEDTIRNLQDRLALAKQYDAVGKNAPTMFSEVIEMGRNKITFKNIATSDGTLKIEAQAPNSSALSQFVNNLKRYPGVTSVIIDNVENRTTNSVIIMNITANFKKS
jgi:hypothetical protein